jgi:single-strand DNA-binding protein
MSVNNRITLIGRVGKDPEMRRFDGGSVAVRLSVATSEKYTNKQGQKVEQTEWHTCTAWGKLAEIIEQYSFKGQQVALSGRMTYRSWQDRNGNNRLSPEIIVEEFQMLSKKKEKVQEARQEAPPAPNTETPSEPLNGDDDLPF